VPVLVLDNASQDDTKEYVESLCLKNTSIQYFRNEKTVMPDENFEKALVYAESDYVWLLGDSYVIPEGAFSEVMKLLAEDDFDAVIVNMAERVNDIEAQVYTDKDKLLSDIGWHMTCMSTLIYNKRLLKNADFTRYRDTNFLQAGIIFEYLADKPFKVKWIPQHSVLGLDVPGLKKTSWQAQTFEIWTKRWANFVFSLPASYSLDAKLKCIMDHGFKSKVFTLSALKHLRRKGILNHESYRNYSRYFPLTIKYHPLLIRLLATLPRSVTRLF
jgi:glycosyltransferase involved in cell wall biosynthesis